MAIKSRPVARSAGGASLPCGARLARNSEADFGADGNQAWVEFQAIRVGLVVVVVHAEAEVVAEVVANARAGVPAVGCVIGMHRQAGDQSVTLDVGAEQAGASAQVPVVAQVQVRIDASGP